MSSRRAVRGSRVARSDPAVLLLGGGGGAPCFRGVPGAEGVGVDVDGRGKAEREEEEEGLAARTPGTRTRSSWNSTRAATSRRPNSRARCVPAATGAVKRGHRARQARRSAVRPPPPAPAGRISASCVAAANRAHSSAVSAAVEFGSGFWGEGGPMCERMAMYSVFVYAGNASVAGALGRRRDVVGGLVVMKIVVKFGIWGGLSRCN